jgi:hypothetical protein
LDHGSLILSVGKPNFTNDWWRAAVRRCSSREDSAKILGIDPSTLYRKRSHWGFDPSFRERSAAMSSVRTDKRYEAHRCGWRSGDMRKANEDWTGDGGLFRQ